jgi:hypothetical protein
MSHSHDSHIPHRHPVARDVSRASHASTRLTHIDTIRGLLLVLMALNHIPSDLHAVTDHPLGFMSAAEGFVFMAGLMAGFVYTRTWLRGTFETLKHACKRRAISIYRWHVATFLTVIAGLLIAGFSIGALPANTPSALLEHPSLTVITGVLLVQQPTLFDILPLYCVLLLLTPWCLRMCSRGGYAHLVFGSLGLWAAANIFCPQTPFDNGWINTGAFNLAAWQLLYVAGLAFGHRWAQHQQETKNDPSSAKPHLLKSPGRPALLGLIAIAIGLFSVRHGFVPSGLSETVLGALNNKNNFAPLRLLDTALILYLGYLAVSRFPRAFSWRPLAWIGRASLTVFSIHVVAAYAIHAWPEFFADTYEGRWLGTALMLLTLAAAAAAHEFLAPEKEKHARPAPSLSAPPLQTRQRRTRRLIVRHEPRSPGPADSLHRRSR